MTLLLLFSDQVAAASSGDAVMTMLVETAANTWYDATSDLISGTITRGRQNQLDRYQAGTCEVLLDNDDRKYDPTYASSPIYGHVLPMKRVQIKNTYAGITYPVFTGYADRWTQNRDGPHRGTTSLAATDGFKVLERTQLASSAYAQEVIADGPVAWWRLGEASGAATAFDSAGSQHAAYSEAPQLGATGLVSREAGTSARFNTAGSPRAVRPGNIITAYPFTIEVVGKFSSGDVGDTPIYGEAYTTGGSTPAQLALVVQFNGTVLFQMNQQGTVAAVTLFSDISTLDDDQVHHVAVVFDADQSGRVYVDGVDHTSIFGMSSFPFPATRVQTVIGNNPAGFTNNPGAGYLQEIAVYNTALSATRLAAHVAAISTPWNGDLSGARITRVLDAVGWPATDRSIDTGETTLQSAALDNMTALEHVQKVADTEAGSFYVTAGGTIRFEERNSSVNQSTLFAFSDAAGAGLPITFSNPEINDEQIRNDVTVSRLEGIAQTVRDATSIATYKTSSYVRDGLYNNGDAHSHYLADFILQGYKDPVERVSAMAVNPYAAPSTLWPAVLGIELTDRITLAETPQWVTPAVTRTVVVEGISHSFSAKTWESSFNLSQNTTATQAYWALGVAGFSELGQTTRLFF